MPGVRWTARGAVALPETLQVRISPLFSGRIAAGAPAPGRALTPDEVDQNVRWFCEPGPRGRPVRGLVLSGLPEDVDRLALSVRAALERSVVSVVAHVEGPRVPMVRASALAPLVSRWVVVARAPEEVIDGVDVVVPLEAEVLPRVGAIAAAAARVRRLTWTWPYPRGDAFVPPPVAAALDAVRAALPALREIDWHFKGLPPCVTMGLDPRVVAESGRASNRWYVDADHQRDRALLFQPEVLSLIKQEVCRFCAVDTRCDGAPERWMRLGMVPSFLPIREVDGDGVARYALRDAPGGGG